MSRQDRTNAEALVRREAPYPNPPSGSRDYRTREPRTLREAVDLVRQAYADDVPAKLHEGPDAIGPDGTPKMTPRAEQYLFGNPQADDAGRDPVTGQRDLVGYHLSPFRARLAEMSRGNGHDRARAKVVTRVAIGGQGPIESALAEGAPLWGAHTLAMDALTTFLRGMTDLQVHTPRGIVEGT